MCRICKDATILGGVFNRKLSKDAFQASYYCTNRISSNGGVATLVTFKDKNTQDIFVMKNKDNESMASLV